MSWLDQSTIRSSIGAEGGATLRFFGPPIHFLGGSHRFYPLKERRKAKVRRPSAPPVTPRCRTGGWDKPQMGLVATRRVCATWLCKDVGIQAEEQRLQLLLSHEARLETGKADRRGHSRRYPASCTLGFQCRSCCTNYVRPPSSFRNNSAF